MTSAALYDISFANASNLDAEVYLLAKGQVPGDNSGSATAPDGTTHDFSMIESYLQFDPATGVGKPVRVDAATGGSAAYSVKMSDLPANPDGSVTLKVPQTIGARIYISLDKTVYLTETVGYKVVDGKQVPDTLSLAEPNAGDPADPSYATIFDKVEYTYNDDGVWIDTTAVDFFSMPLSLTAAGQTVGLQQTRSAVLGALHHYFGEAGASAEWQKLELTYTNDDNTVSVLRVVAPNKSVGDDPFSTTYLDDYIAAVWDYFRANPLYVDCSEISVKDGPSKKSPAGVMTGTVTGSGETVSFTFTSQDGGTPDVVVGPGYPTSNQVFGCGQGIMEAQPGTVQSVIVRGLATGMNIGRLPGTTTAADPLKKSWFTDQEAQYYTTNPLAVPGSGQPAPWFNVYSQALHSFGDSVYAFAFDDAAGQDSTIHITDLGKGSLVTIGDMTGTVLPDTTDTTEYTVTFVVPKDCSGSYTNPNDGNKVYALKAGDSVTAVKVRSPLSFEWDNGTGARTYTVDVKLKTSTPRGCTIDDSASPAITVKPPGKPATNVVAVPTSDHHYWITMTPASGCSGSFGGKAFTYGVPPGNSQASVTSATISFSYKLAAEGSTMVDYTYDIETGVLSPTGKGLVAATIVVVQDATTPSTVSINLPAG